MVKILNLPPAGLTPIALAKHQSSLQNKSPPGTSSNSVPVNPVSFLGKQINSPDALSVP